VRRAVRPALARTESVRTVLYACSVRALNSDGSGRGRFRARGFSGEPGVRSVVPGASDVTGGIVIVRTIAEGSLS
jgi:hypothetical protein